MLLGCVTFLFGYGVMVVGLGSVFGFVVWCNLLVWFVWFGSMFRFLADCLNLLVVLWVLVSLFVVVLAMIAVGCRLGCVVGCGFCFTMLLRWFSGVWWLLAFGLCYYSCLVRFLLVWVWVVSCLVLILVVLYVADLCKLCLNSMVCCFDVDCEFGGLFVERMLRFVMYLNVGLVGY